MKKGTDWILLQKVWIEKIHWFAPFILDFYWKFLFQQQNDPKNATLLINSNSKKRA